VLRKRAEWQQDGEGDRGGGGGGDGGGDRLVTAEMYVPRLAPHGSHRRQYPLGGWWQRQPAKV
jgi:hypothetical protein